MGTALSFNGDGDYLSLDNPDSLAFTGQITVSVWSRLASNASGFRNIVAHGHVSNPAGEYFLRVSNGNTYQGGSWDGGDHKATLPIPESDYGTWVHLASVYDGTSWHLYHAWRSRLIAGKIRPARSPWMGHGRSVPAVVAPGATSMARSTR